MTRIKGLRPITTTAAEPPQTGRRIIRGMGASSSKGARCLNFTAPLPPRELSPNSRPHWAKKARAVAEYRRDVGLSLLAAVGVGYVPKFERANISLEFVFRDERRRDEDNLTAAWKAGQDALVDVGLLSDDSSEHLRIAGVTWRKAERGEATGVKVQITKVGE